MLTAPISATLNVASQGTPVHRLAYLSTWAATHFNSARLVQIPWRQVEGVELNKRAVEHHLGPLF